MFPRKLECYELMMVMSAARRRERSVADPIVAAVTWKIIAPLRTLGAYRAVTIQVQAKFQTIRVKSAPPVEAATGAKIVPLDREANFIYITVQWTPSLLDLAPGTLLGGTTRVHLG